jgi:hypothetical protein
MMENILNYFDFVLAKKCSGQNEGQWQGIASFAETSLQGKGLAAKKHCLQMSGPMLI